MNKVYTIIKFTFNVILFALIIISCEDSSKPNDNNDNNSNDGPKIIKLSTDNTYPGHFLTITGDKFGFERGTSYIEINGLQVNEYISWSYSQIEFFVPENATSGKLFVSVNGVKSNEVNLTINDKSTDPAPVITAFDNTKPFTRTLIGVNGKNFGDERGNSFIIFNGVMAKNYTMWNDNKIVVEVPTGATTGDVYVVVKGQKSNPSFLNIQDESFLLEEILISGGEFMMGDDNEEGFGMAPAHKVVITKPFYISKYEITQENWDKIKAIIGKDHNSYHKGPNYPVERVSWIDACKFCNALSQKERFQKVYEINGNEVTVNWDANGYRLPTEAEWELAARGGSNWKFGKSNDGNDAQIDKIAWHNDNSQNQTHEIGTKEPNAFGLYDMLGNVKEWCWDWYDADYYSTLGDVTFDPKGSDVKDAGRALRGGSYTDDKLKCTVYYRWSNDPTVQGEFFMGFRVVRNK